MAEFIVEIDDNGRNNDLTHDSQTASPRWF